MSKLSWIVLVVVVLLQLAGLVVMEPKTGNIIGRCFGRPSSKANKVRRPPPLLEFHERFQSSSRRPGGGELPPSGPAETFWLSNLYERGGVSALNCLQTLDGRVIAGGIPPAVVQFTEQISESAPHSSLYDLATQTNSTEFQVWVGKVERPKECDEHEKLFDEITCLRNSYLRIGIATEEQLRASTKSWSTFDRVAGLWACRNGRLYGSSQQP